MLHRILTVVAAVALLGACDAAPTAVARPPHAPHATLLTAYVQGSSAARYGDTCLYEAIASGGTAPYTYKWGTLQSGWDLSADPNSSLWQWTYGAFGQANHVQTVVVDVKDATGTVQRASLNVTLTTQGTSC